MIEERMSCVVCGGEVLEAQYANAWEASLKQHPCCSRACCEAFDPDVHWFPVVLPEALDEEEAARRVELGKRRIRQGDAPRLVARDLLLAGVPPWMVRRSLLGAAADAVSSDRTTSRWNLWGAVTTLLTGHGVLVGDRDRGLTNAGEALDGSSEIDAWERHFGLNA